MSKITIKEKIDNIIYSSYNAYSNLSFFIGRNKRIVEKNTKFKNLHNGSRCFILGTGPSLKNFNAKYLDGEVVIGVNFLHKSHILDDITPAYYFLFDNIFYSSALDTTKELFKRFPNTVFFLRTKAIDRISKLNINNNNIYYQHCNLFQYNDYVKVDISKNVTAPYNVIIGCIQTALYMGFKEIYLLGCDFNSFANLKVEHCYDGDIIPDRHMSLGFELKYYSMVSYHHYALEKFSRKNDIRIYNLTPNSLLDAYERKK